MPIRCIVAARSLAALLGLLIGIQTFLPQLHGVSAHLHPRPAAVGHPSSIDEAGSAASGAGDASEDGCPVCHLLLAAGAVALPEPTPATGPVAAPVADRPLFSWSVRAHAPPASVWSSPRGPPTA